MSASDGRIGESEPGHVLVERPPPGLARGKYSAPAWVVASLGAALLLGALAYVIRRFVRIKR